MGVCPEHEINILQLVTRYHFANLNILSCIFVVHCNDAKTSFQKNFTSPCGEKFKP